MENRSLQVMHKPVPITKEDFDQCRLKPLSHSPESIAAAIIEFNNSQSRDCKTSDLPPRQRTATERFLLDGSWNLGNPHNLSDLNKYFDIFNGNYFNGLLSGFCSIELLSHADMKAREGKNLGYCRPFFPGKERDPRFSIEKPRIQITIRKLDIMRPTPTEAVQQYLAILLHEMLHAMFDIYSCICDRGCSQKKHEEASGGHHVAWQMAARCLEIASLDRGGHPGLGVNLNRESSLAVDIVRGYNLPSRATLDSISIHDLKLTLLIQWHKDTFEKQKHHERTYFRPIKSSNSCVRNEWTVDRWERNFGFKRGSWAHRLREKGALNEVPVEERKVGNWVLPYYSIKDLAKNLKNLNFERQTQYRERSLMAWNR